MIRLKPSTLFLHIASWLLFMSFPLMFLSQGRASSDINTATISAYLLFCGLYIAIFYINTKFIIPAFFLNRKYLAYGASILIMFAAVYMIKPFDTLVNNNSRREEVRNQPPEYQLPPPPPGGRPPEDGRFGPPRGNNFDITSLFIFIMIIGIGTAFESTKQWYLFEQRSVKAESEKATAELSFLKAQINPHFLYNTLNNIYTLCITGSENAAESIMKLSNIMRYVTDESDADFVPLEDEINCISNFIALQKLRLGKKVTLNYAVEGDPTGHRITPLILMTYVENVFKYGLSNHIDAQIDISIKTDGSKTIFYTRNQIFEHKTPNARKGVGLENTSKRLSYLYPNKHTLEINDRDGLFTVLLILESK
ncbi:MAG: histidine kinase [Pedobacter sp.]|nr:MAG: histidine kinase [Pedobacter sp.]